MNTSKAKITGICVLLFLIFPPPSPADLQDESESLEAEAASAAERVDVLYRELGRAMAEIPRESFDPQAVVRSVGRDPEKLFQWVRDNTALVPYDGSLKGPVGVLLDGCGNSLDRALLLFDLLKKAGHNVRLVTGTLTPEQADAIMDRAPGKALALSPSPDSITEPDYRERIKTFSQEIGMEPGPAEEEVAAALKEAQLKHVELSRRIRTQSEALLDALAPHHHDPGSPPHPDIKEHWWVQWQSEGRWVDLDPSLSGNEPGDSLTAASRTQGSDRIANDKSHRMTVRLISERLENGRLLEDKVLEQGFTPSQSIGRTLRLRIQPLGWPDFDSLQKEKNSEEALKQAVLSQEEWLPVLSLDGREYKKSSILLSGRANPTPGRKPRNKSGGAGGLMGGFARASGASTEGQSLFTALWLEFEILSPGEAPPNVLRRPIFDLIGADGRKKGGFSGFKVTEEKKRIRSLRLLAQVDILPMVSFFTPRFVEVLGAEYLIGQKKNLIDSLRRMAELQPDALLEKLGQVEFGPQTLLEAALARKRLIPEGESLFVDRINLIAHWTFLEEDPQGEWLDIQALDILENSTSSHLSGEEDFSRRVCQGVVDTNAEIKPWLDAAPQANASQIFVASREAGIDWILVRGKEDPGWKRVEVDRDIRALVERDIEGGYFVFLPEKTVPMGGSDHYAWWRIDPRNGATLGIGPDGMGQALTGYAQRANIVLQLRTVVNMYAGFFRCLGIAVTSPLRGESSAAGSNAFIQCALTMVCKAAFKLGTSFASVDVNWTNLIIKTTLGWATGKLCAGLAKEVAGR